MPVPEISDAQFAPWVARNASSCARVLAGFPPAAFTAASHAAVHSAVRTARSAAWISAAIIAARTAAVTASVPAIHWAISACACAMAEPNAALDLGAVLVSQLLHLLLLPGLARVPRLRQGRRRLADHVPGRQSLVQVLGDDRHQRARDVDRVPVAGVHALAEVPAQRLKLGESRLRRRQRRLYVQGIVRRPAAQAVPGAGMNVARIDVRFAVLRPERAWEPP